jgi:hypothetical protein
MPKIDIDGVALTRGDGDGGRKVLTKSAPFKFPTRVWEPIGYGFYNSREVTKFDLARRQVVSDWLNRVISVQEYRELISAFGY